MNIAETRRTQALALQLSAELSEAADELTAQAMKPNITSNELLDFVFSTVNTLREKFDSEFTERTITSYEQAVS